MTGPALTPPAQTFAPEPSRVAVLLEMQHQLDVANDSRPTPHDTRTPKGFPGLSGAAVHPVGAGDLGRRIVQRRAERGLSRDEVARRAGWDSGYLEYLEESSTPVAPLGGLYRLAAVLETTVAALQGHGFGQPVGSSGHPAGNPHMEVLDAATCRDLIRGGGIGRVVFADARGPLALPVNFRTIRDEVVFQTGHGAIAAAMTSGRPLSVEVDRFDDALGEGWSVLLRGHGMVLTGAAALSEVHQLDIQSWAGAQRSTAVRLIAEEVTGRRVLRHL
jgi:transcriptional regulator with XRE-family HTH domain